MSNLVLTGDLKLEPLDLLANLGWMAALEILALSAATGELEHIHQNWQTIVESGALPVVFMSGISSFSLNITSFYANKVWPNVTEGRRANKVLYVASKAWSHVSGHESFDPLSRSQRKASHFDHGCDHGV